MIDLSKLNGEQLFIYYTSSYCKDDEYSSVVQLLPLAVGNIERAFELLEALQQKGQRLVAIYPGNNEKPTSEMQLVGSIPDGALYYQ